MKKFHWTRATGLAAALFLTTGLSSVSAQGLLNGLGGGGAGGGAGGQAAGGGAAGGAGGPRAGLGSRLDVNSSVRGVNPAQAMRGATNAGAGLGGTARAQGGLGVGANGSGAGVRAQGEGAARGRTGLFSNTNVGAGAETDAGIDADVSVETSMDRRSLTGREHAGHQAEMTLNHRLAEIDRLRDHALSTGNTVQLAKADELEAQARATFQHRLDVIQTAPDAEAAPPGAPRDIRSRIRAGMGGQTNIGAPAGTDPTRPDFAGDAEEATDIAVQRPEDFGRMRQRTTAGARTESKGLLHFAPRGGAAGATGNVAAQSEERFGAELNPRGRVEAASDSLLEAEMRVEQTSASRVRPVASSRFAADLQGQGTVPGGNTVRSGGAVRGDVQGDPLLDTRGGMPRTRQQIEQVDYSPASGSDASGRAGGRVSSATYAEADNAFGNVPRNAQRPRAEATGAIRAGQNAGQGAGQSGWDGIEDAEFRSDIRQETRARFPADRNATGALNGAGEGGMRFDERTDIPRRPMIDEPVPPPADPRFRGRAAADVDADGAVRRSDNVYSASSNVRGRTGTSASSSSIRSRSQFDAPGGASRQPINPDEYGNQP